MYKMLWFSYLEIIWTFWILLLRFVSWVHSNTVTSTNFSPQWKQDLSVYSTWCSINEGFPVWLVGMGVLVLMQGDSFFVGLLTDMLTEHYLGCPNLHPVNSFSVITWGNPNAHLIYFPLLRDHCPSCPISTVSKSVAYVFHSFFGCFQNGVKSIFVSPSCSEVEASLQLILTKQGIKSEITWYPTMKPKLRKISFWLIYFECKPWGKSVLFSV